LPTGAWHELHGNRIFWPARWGGRIIARASTSGAAHVAQWIGDHPQRVVKEYHCEYPRIGKKAEAG
jgi:hypothetical protein